MELVKCLIHEEKFMLPSTEKEFLAGELHDQVELCVKHSHENPSCKFILGEDES